MLFAESLSGAKGGTAPEAFPSDTKVPFLFNILKLLSKLKYNPLDPDRPGEFR